MATAGRFQRAVDPFEKQWIVDFQTHIGLGAFGRLAGNIRQWWVRYYQHLRLYTAAPVSRVADIHPAVIRDLDSRAINSSAPNKRRLI